MLDNGVAVVEVVQRARAQLAPALNEAVGASALSVQQAELFRLLRDFKEGHQLHTHTHTARVVSIVKMSTYLLNQGAERITVQKFDLDPVVYENDLDHREVALLQLGRRERGVCRAAVGGRVRGRPLWRCLRVVVGL